MKNIMLKNTPGVYCAGVFEFVGYAHARRHSWMVLFSLLILITQMSKSTPSEKYCVLFLFLQKLPKKWANAIYADCAWAQVMKFNWIDRHTRQHHSMNTNKYHTIGQKTNGRKQKKNTLNWMKPSEKNVRKSLDSFYFGLLVEEIKENCFVASVLWMNFLRECRKSTINRFRLSVLFFIDKSEGFEWFNICIWLYSIPFHCNRSTNISYSNLYWWTAFFQRIP